MAKDYKLTAFEKSDFQDANKNYWCTAVFEGVGEPVKWVVKDPMTVEVGNSYYGRIEDWTSSKGKTMPRFFREKREDSPSQASFSAKPQWQPRDDSHIRAQWAIGQAVQTLGPFTAGTEYFERVEENATRLYAMVDRVKGSDVVTGSRGSSESANPKLNSHGEQTDTMNSSSSSSHTNPGTTKEFTNQSDVEFATNMARNLDKGIPVTEEFNMEDIPF